MVSDVTFFLENGQDDLRDKIHQAIGVAKSPGSQSVQQVPSTPAGRETVVIREIVKIRCRYCGQLVPQGVPKCDSCGAPVR